MILKETARCLLVLVCILILTACERSIDNAIDQEMIHDEYTIIHKIVVGKGDVVFFERTRNKDVGIAFIDKSRRKSKTQIGGYLGLDDDDASWHYSSADLGGEELSVYYGRLSDNPHGKNVWIHLGEEKKRATLFESSSRTLWVVLLTERLVVNEIKVIY